jgi:hypothetical protein
MTMMNFEHARAIADAVLVEGYAPYPARVSTPNHRLGWTSGVLAPRAWSEAGGGEPWWLETQLLAAGPPSRIAGRIRFFQIERRCGDPAAGTADWDEGIIRNVDFEIDAARACVPFSFDGRCAITHGQFRERHTLVGCVQLRCEVVVSERSLVKLTIRVENRTPWSEPGAPRAQAMLAAMASTHVLVGVEGGQLLSATDPASWPAGCPADWAAAAARCTSVGTHPVLLGPPGRSDLVLAAPFLLHDHPEIAPDGAGDPRHDDPAAELYLWYGLCHRDRLDEIDPR